MRQDQISRRGLLTSVAFVPVSALVGSQTAEAQKAAGSALDATARETLAAFVDRLVPADSTGPGALECGAHDYIIRALGDFLASEQPQIVKSLADIDAWSIQTRGKSFRTLAAEERDAVIGAMASNEAKGFDPDARAVFLRLRQLTLEGMFSDPFYGGNKGFAGWDLLRYPGPRMAVAPDDQKLAMPKAMRRSAYGAQYGH